MSEREYTCWRCDRVVAKGRIVQGAVSVTCKRCGAIVVCHGEVDSAEIAAPSYVSTPS